MQLLPLSPLTSSSAEFLLLRGGLASSLFLLPQLARLPPPCSPLLRTLCSPVSPTGTSSSFRPQLRCRALPNNHGPAGHPMPLYPTPFTAPKPPGTLIPPLQREGKLCGSRDLPQCLAQCLAQSWCSANIGQVSSLPHQSGGGPGPEWF